MEIFLMGDFNIDLNNKQSAMVRELPSSTEYWGLSPQIKEVTRLGNGVDGVLKGTCIDNIFTNSTSIEKTLVMDWNLSDHLMVAVKSKRERVIHPKVVFTGRSMHVRTPKAAGN